MLFCMLVGLCTSHVVLQTSGVEYWGIYGVVGGVVTMVGFLNTSFVEIQIIKRGRSIIQRCTFDQRKKPHTVFFIF